MFWFVIQGDWILGVHLVEISNMYTLPLLELLLLELDDELTRRAMNFQYFPTECIIFRFVRTLAYALSRTSTLEHHMNGI